MSKSLLVDGNNVMGQRVGWHRDKAGARHRLIRELSQFAQATGTPIEVVFDGVPDDDFPDGSMHGGVLVHYANRGSDADTRIAELVERSSAPEALTVVTSDQRLADRVRRLSAQVIRSGELRRNLDSLDERGVTDVAPADRARRVARRRDR
jgi:predicted RNA-binding protein with PIN domain